MNALPQALPPAGDGPPAAAHAELLRLLADNVPAFIAYYDAITLTCSFANQRYAETFGFTTQTIVGRRLDEVIGEETVRRVQPHLDHVLEQGLPALYERELATAEGTLHVEVHLLPHFGPDARVVGLFVLISDITRHRNAEIAVRESEERLAKFMQASTEGIVFHKDGFITDANPPILQLTGYALPELLGRRTLEFIAPDHVARLGSPR